MTKKIKLIPFDWRKYKAGAKPVFKYIPERIILNLFKSGLEEMYPIHCVFIDHNDDTSSSQESYTKDGKFEESNDECELDLFLEQELEGKTF